MRLPKTQYNIYISNRLVAHKNMDNSVFCGTAWIRIMKGRNTMPELSRFGGMVIYMLFMDTKQHNKPHVHVYYGDYEAAIGIDGELLAGSIPKKQFKMVVGWLAFHEEEAYKAWNLAVRGEHFDKIAPM